MNRGWIPEEIARDCNEKGYEKGKKMTFVGFLQKEEKLVMCRNTNARLPIHL